MYAVKTFSSAESDRALWYGRGFTVGSIQRVTSDWRLRGMTGSTIAGQETTAAVDLLY